MSLLSPRTVLIRQSDEPLNRFELVRWPASLTLSAAAIVVHDLPTARWKRARRH